MVLQVRRRGAAEREAPGRIERDVGTLDVQLRDVSDLAGIFPLDVSRAICMLADERRRDGDLAIHGNRRRRHRRPRGRRCATSRRRCR